jgi:hypothetical protein
LKPIRAIVVPVDTTEPLRLEEIDPTDLNAYRRLVGDASIEVVNLERPDASLYMDEEGKLKELPVNERLTAFAWVHQSALRHRQDPVVGPGFIVGPADREGVDQTVPEDLVNLLIGATRFRIQVQTEDDPKWYGNQRVYQHLLDAYIEAVQLAFRWTRAEEVRVVPELDDELRETWYRIGKTNTWIKEAEDPPFTKDSFVGCFSVEELGERIGFGNWSIGTAFYYRDLCFINQINGGDEWLTIRHGIPFESITFKTYIERGEFPTLIRRLLTATKEQCQQLTY